MADSSVAQGHIMFLPIFLGLVLPRSWGCGMECSFDSARYRAYLHEKKPGEMADTSAIMGLSPRMVS